MSTIVAFAADPITNDMYLDDFGNIALVYDLEAVLQGCRQAALTQLGEIVLATNQGIPYQTAIWVGVPNIAAYEAALRTAWLSLTGVVSIIQLTTVFVSPTLSYSATINTIFGSGSIASGEIFNG